MINRGIRELPYPAVSEITNEIAREIIAIPDEAIEYTPAEVAWMGRAIENLDYMIAHGIEHGSEDVALMQARRAEIEKTFNGCQK